MEFTIKNQQIIATDNDGKLWNLNPAVTLLTYAISKVLPNTDNLLDKRSLIMASLPMATTDTQRLFIKRELLAIDYLIYLNNT